MLATSYGRLNAVVDTRERFKANINRLFDQTGLTRAAFARRLGRSRTWASNVLNGDATVTVAGLGELARFFGVDPADLIRMPSKEMTQPVTPPGVSLTPHQESTYGAAEISRLNARISDLERTQDTLRAAIDRLAHEQVDSANVRDETGTTPHPKSRSGRRARSAAR